MQIIQTLRNNTTPDTADQLFKTLVETSETVESQNKELADKVEEGKEETETKKSIGIEDQLTLLLTNLNKNSLLNQKRPVRRNMGPSTMKPEVNSALPDQLQPTTQPTQLITQAYHLINEVIMYPQIMWTRNFFYSLGAMSTSQQTIMHEWFSEMNEKQQIYIKEIERANQQLKETSAEMFRQKGFSEEQTNLFLKKVNFMENREYFFHKRKTMSGFPAEQSEMEDRGHQNSYRGNRGGHRGSYRGNVGNRGGYSNHAKWASRKDHPGAGKENKNFFDTMGTSCNQDEKEKQRRNSETYDRKVRFQGGRAGGSRQVGRGGNWKPSHYQQTEPHRKYTE